MLRIMNQQEFDNIFDDLTKRQKQVLYFALQGESDKAMAERLGVRPTTVRKHLERVAEIFGLQSPERRSRRNEIFALIAKYKPELLDNENPETIEIAENDNVIDLHNHKKNYLLFSTSTSNLSNTNFVETESQSLLKLLALAKDEENQKKVARELNKVGYKHFLQGQLKDAKEHFNLAIEYDPMFVYAHYNLGSTYEKLGEEQKACEHYEIASKSQTDAGYAAINNLARLSIIKGDFQKAIEYIKPIVDKVEEPLIKTSLYKNLAWAIYCEIGDLDLVKTYLDASLQLNQNYLPSLYLLILVLLERADLRRDQKAINKALEIWDKCHYLETLESSLQISDKLIEVDYWNSEIHRKLKRYELCAV